jgi:SecD/SecF fusion protein
MFKRNLWKILLSLAIAGWAVSELLPYKDIPFPTYARSARHREDRGVRQAPRMRPPPAMKAGQGLQRFSSRSSDRARAETRPDASIFRHPGNREQPAQRRQAQRDPAERAAASLQGPNSSSALTSQAASPSPSRSIPRRVRRRNDLTVGQEKLSKAIDIITARVNGIGVGEPLIRPVGDNRIEVELPGVNTKDNPESSITSGSRRGWNFRGASDPHADTVAPGDVPRATSHVARPPGRPQWRRQHRGAFHQADPRDDRRNGREPPM